MSYKHFFPGFTVDVSIPPTWTDATWHGSPSPAWFTQHDAFLVLVSDDRSVSPRFHVFDLDGQGRQAATAVRLRTNDWADVLSFVATALPGTRVVAENALEAFWAVVARAYPTATTGDLDPIDISGLEDAAENATDTWVHNNVPAPHLPARLAHPSPEKVRWEGHLWHLHATGGNAMAYARFEGGREYVLTAEGEMREPTAGDTATVGCYDAITHEQLGDIRTIHDWQPQPLGS